MPSRLVRTSAVAAAALLALASLALVAVAEEGPEETLDRTALEAARRHAVLVSFTFQRDAAREETGATPPDGRALAERYRFWRLSWVVPGIVARDARSVLISDPWVSPTAVAGIEIVEQDGRRTPAVLDGILPGAEAAWVRAEADLTTAPVVFSPEPGDAWPDRLFATSVAEGADGPELWAEPLGTARRRPWRADGASGFGRPAATFDGIARTGEDGERHIDLVVDAAGLPWGFRFGEALDADGRWRGTSVLEQEMLPYAALPDMEGRLAESGQLHRVSVAYRTTSRHDRRRNPFGMGSRGTAEQDFWGLAVAPDLLLVPADLDDEQVRRIVSIRLPDRGDGAAPTAEAEFAGRVRGYRAFLVRVPDAAFRPVTETSPAPGPGGLLLVHRVARRGGARRDSLDPNRVLGRSRGYGDRRFLATERAVEAGVFLRDGRGELVGFTAVLDPADRDYAVGGSRGGARSPFPPVAVLPAELGGLVSLLEQPDTQVMPQEEAESHRRPWLGVEADDLDEGVADLLDVSLPTRDGRRGLVVVRVYEGSPAARAGLEEGDILLSARRLTAPGGPETDLRGGGSRPFLPAFFGGAGAPAPWRERDNALTTLFGDWGTDTEYELLWLRKGEPHRSTLRVEMAPPDFASAPREFDEATGLEVRDLTYEVRAALRMTADAPGVVIARVEPGTKAAQARLEPNEILVEVDGAPIASAAAFQELLERARADGRKTLRLVVRRLDRTRLVDLQPGAAGEDGEGK